MALAISNIVLCAKSLNSPRTRSLQQTSLPNSPSSLNRLFWKTSKSKIVVHCAASAAGSPGQNGDVSPYEILGVNPIEGFDMVKAAYTRKHRDALMRGDDALLSQLERAYDKIMMAQLSNRKQGVTYGSFQVSKDIKYADKLPVVPWAPRFTKSSVNDMRINLAISAVFTAWIFIKRYAEWKPLQFLAFVFVYRIFEKLKAFEPPVSPTATEDGEDEGRALRMGKRLVRSLALVFGCIALASMGFTGILNIIEFVGGYIPAFLYNNQYLHVSHIDNQMLEAMQKHKDTARIELERFQALQLAASSRISDLQTERTRANTTKTL
ncbi:Protein CHAPERONE-LIKE PROTEIN OF POR1-like [Dillenia turbinata]|uniref:Protein CHAPERONE-LIKE PROTEIN OF POR1-like n=1 Tax=Dillenia turbinata TaxID=194707 RepID=A0AAN8YWX7_9MAGN